MVLVSSPYFIQSQSQTLRHWATVIVNLGLSILVVCPGLTKPPQQLKIISTTAHPCFLIYSALNCGGLPAAVEGNFYVVLYLYLLYLYDSVSHIHKDLLKSRHQHQLIPCFLIIKTLKVNLNLNSLFFLNIIVAIAINIFKNKRIAAVWFFQKVIINNNNLFPPTYHCTLDNAWNYCYQQIVRTKNYSRFTCKVNRKIFLLFAKVLWALLRTEEDALLNKINFHFLICALSSSVALTWMFLANSSHTPVSYTLHFFLKRTLHIIHWSIHKGRVHLLSLILDCYFVTTPPPSLDCK